MKNTLILFIVTLFSLSYAQGEKTIYFLTSGDGTTFSNETYFRDSADVPSMAQHPDGTIIATYQSFSGGFGSSGWDKIGVRFSSDNGISWTPHQLINLTGFTGSATKAFDPTITITETGDYRLYFSYCPNTTMLDSTCDTYSAISSDGINYTFESGTRMDISNWPVIDPATLYFGSQWHYINPIGAPSDGGRHAISSDGLNFTVIDTAGISGPGTNWTGNLMNNGANMRFYGGSSMADNYTIWWNETTDGSTWSGYTWTNVSGSKAKDPGIVKLANGSYLMLVSKDSANPSASITANSQNLNIKIYPNPVEDKFRIEGTNQALDIKIFNSLGQEVLSAKNVYPNESTDCSQLNQGIYVCQFSNEAYQLETIRFIKK